MNIKAYWFTGVVTVLLSTGCSDPEPITDQRYAGSDALFQQLESNLAKHSDWRKVIDIDHSRLGYQAGSTMPPARVLIVSNPKLDTAIIQQNPLAAIDMPLRILAYEEKSGGESKLIYNRFQYIASRYGINDPAYLAAAYQHMVDALLVDIPKSLITDFPSATMPSDGIITIKSPFDFDTSLKKIAAAINSQDDTVSFGEVDFQQQAAELGIDLLPNTLVLFGGPAPGAKAMSAAPTLGLDAFCQKFLLWQDKQGQVYLSFNDLVAMAERQGVNTSIALRVINFRLNSVFSEALAQP
ncbi:DUF302 domain-containing protein [Oceanicoccus sagamiensis]|uniref:DUF302 domain-containing protein n=1 Tax=Oceanicoccus sagamiensis TaxID=716816 RepID=A0A1X9NAR8_9GAMM|nr:DUF302 domain-containing protein [Oceanicoccus sagamiensis]ARN74251.1 hypothetical protein BST96_09040 [Oceanicoccus sagamiensis]